MSLQFVNAFDTPKSHDDTIWALKWTEANTVLSAGSDGKLILWDPSNGSPIRAFPQHPLALVAISTDAEGKTALSNSIEGTTILWDLSTGDAIGRREGFGKGQKGSGSEPSWSVSLNPKGGTYAASNASGNVNIFSASADDFGTQIQSLSTGRNKFGLTVAHSPDGSRVALSTEAGTIYIFDIESTALSATFSSHAMSVRSLAWSPDSQLLLSASDDKRLVLHDVRTSTGGKPGSGAVASFNGHASWALSGSISADNKLAVSGSADRAVKVWDIGARSCVCTIQEQEEVWGVAWKPGSSAGPSSFASTGGEGCVRFWRGAGSS